MTGTSTKKLAIGSVFLSLVVLPMVFIVSAFFFPRFALADSSPLPTTPADITDSYFQCGIGINGTITGCIVQGFKMIFVDLPAWVFAGTGVIFDTVMGLSFSSNLIKNASFVDAGWVLCRDIANTFFIFILLYIAIITILRADTSSTRQMLASLIMVALLMNFSLYITRFVIDVGNVFGLEFYTAIGDPNKTPYLKISDVEVRSISGGFAGAFGIQKGMPSTLFSSLKDQPGAAIFAFFMTGVMLVSASYAFLVASFLFLSRILVFWLCMIFSPLAFFSFADPTGKLKSKLWGKWSSNLINAAFMPAIFLFFVYLIMVLAKSMETNQSLLFQNNYNGGDPTGMVFTTILQIFLNYAVVVGLLFYALSVVRSLSEPLRKYFDVGGVAKTVGLGAAGLAAGAAIGGLAAGGRKFIGGGAQYLQTKYGDKLDTSGKIGQYANKALGGVAASSFDMRAAGLKGVAGVKFGEVSGKGGYKQAMEEKQREIDSRVKSLMDSDPAGAAKYLISQQRTFGSTIGRNRPANTAQGGIRFNPDEYTMGAWKKLDTAARMKLIDSLPDGKDKEYLKKLNREYTQDTVLSPATQWNEEVVRKGVMTPEQQKKEQSAMAGIIMKDKKKTPEEKLQALANIKDEGERKKFYVDTMDARQRKVILDEEKRQEDEAIKNNQPIPEKITEGIQKALTPDEQRKISKELAQQKEEDDFEENKKALGSLEQAAIAKHEANINTFIGTLTGSSHDELQQMMNDYGNLKDEAQGEQGRKIHEAIEKMKGNAQADTLLTQFSTARSERAKGILENMQAKDAAKLSPQILIKKEVSQNLRPEALARITTDSSMLEKDRETIFTNVANGDLDARSERELQQLGENKLNKFFTKDERDKIEEALDRVQQKNSTQRTTTGGTPNNQSTQQITTPTNTPSPIILTGNVYTPKQTPSTTGTFTGGQAQQPQNTTGTNNNP